MSPILYLHGFASSPSSSKARFFGERFGERGIDVKIPDLAEGDFEHLTLTGQLNVIERTAAGRSVTLIGSSMGGYLAALYAARHPEQVGRVVLMAPALCFVRRWPDALGEPAMREWRESGRRSVFHYGEGGERPLSFDLISDGLRYEDYPDVRQPALILHGTRDEVVPIRLSEEFVEMHTNARLIRLDSGHELTDVTDHLWDETARFLGIE
jgi:pimeloyl-ACP methyl ester carboxylesterase